MLEGLGGLGGHGGQGGDLPPVPVQVALHILAILAKFPAASLMAQAADAMSGDSLLERDWCPFDRFFGVGLLSREWTDLLWDLGDLSSLPSLLSFLLFSLASSLLAMRCSDV